MKKEFKNTRYSVKYYPDGRIVAKELKCAICTSRNVEKEIIKNENIVRNLCFDLSFSLDENISLEDSSIVQHQILHQESQLENNEYSIKDIETSIKRTRSKIYDIIYCNSWTYFLTLTFSAEKVNRYDYNEVSKKLRKFLNHYKRIDNDYKYIIIPELHKDGAYHFHGFLYVTDCSKFIDSGVKQNGRIIYNWTKYKLGFSNMTLIDDIEKARTYCMKYITKELITNDDFKGRRFSYSANCEKPIKVGYENFDLTDYVHVKETEFTNIFEFLPIDNTFNL